MTSRIRVELEALSLLRADLERQIAELPRADAVATPDAFGSWDEARWLHERTVLARRALIEVRDELDEALEHLRAAVADARATYSAVDSSSARRARAEDSLRSDLRAAGAA